MLIAINTLLLIIAIYFGIGILFSIYFFFAGAKQMDTGIKESRWFVKLILIPGAIATWPLLLTKLLKTLKK